MIRLKPTERNPSVGLRDLTNHFEKPKEGDYAMRIFKANGKKLSRESLDGLMESLDRVVKVTISFVIPPNHSRKSAAKQ